MKNVKKRKKRDQNKKSEKRFYIYEEVHVTTIIE